MPSPPSMQVASSLSNALSSQLTSTLTAYDDAARAAADSINRHDPPDAFNNAIDNFNTAKTNAINLCRAAY